MVVRTMRCGCIDMFLVMFLGDRRGVDRNLYDLAVARLVISLPFKDAKNATDMDRYPVFFLCHKVLTQLIVTRGLVSIAIMPE
jgi:hypothetical protein